MIHVHAFVMMAARGEWLGSRKVGVKLSFATGVIEIRFLISEPPPPPSLISDTP